MWMLGTAILFCFPLALLGAGLPEASLRDLIPASFPDRDPSNYTIRYLSQLLGSDSEDCLTSQLHTGTDSPAQVQYCRTLRYALTGQHSGDRARYLRNLILVVSPGTYLFNNNGSLEIFLSSNIIIARDPLLSGLGVATLKCDSFNSDRYNNFFFYGTRNLALWGLSFADCGPYAGVGIRYVTNLRIYNCTFRDNLNSGLLVRQASDVVIQDCIFENNMASSRYMHSSNLDFVEHEYQSGGGLTIYQQNTTTLRALVRNCTFRNNSARINATNSEDAAERPILYIPRGHGGGLHIAFENATGNEVIVENCSFIGNSAELTGGAVSVLFYRGIADTNEVKSSSRNNTVKIDSTVFRENECSGNGGAISANTFEAANSSKIFVTNCLFHQNKANDEGGAVSFIIEDNIVINGTGQINNVPIIQGSTFVSNQSPQGGSAISLVSNARVDQETEKAEISDCFFADNYADYHGTLLSLRFPISMKGNNTFKGNMGGAITLLQTQMDTRGSVLFQNNTSTTGGAIKMVDESKVNLFDDVNLTFTENHATKNGGAVKVISSPLFNNLNALYSALNTSGCFFTHAGTHLRQDVNITVLFKNNTAEEDGAAIYATTLLLCTQEGFNLSTFLHPLFQFRDNTVLGRSRIEDTIASEPYFLRIAPLSLNGAPGQKIYLHMGAEGQSGNPQDAVWFTDLNQNRFFSLSPEGKLHSSVVEYPQVQRSYEDMCGTQLYERGELEVLATTYLEFSLIQVFSGTVVNTTSVTLNVTCCNPGYEINNTICVENQTLQDVILRPDSDNKYIYIPLRTYASWRKGSLVWASIPIIFKNCTPDPSGSLPGCLFKYDNPDDQCRNNRTGFLCGKCPANKTADLTLTRCVECPLWHTFMILAIVLAFAVMCALVMIFNVGIPNEMKGILFYIQVIGFVYANLEETDTEDVGWDYYLSNVFGFSLYIPLCPYPGYDASTLHTTVFGFILPIIAIITIVLYIICARSIRHLSNKNSFDGIWFLTFIIYKFVADTCFSILRCQKVNNGRPNEYVYYYDGEVQCFTGEDPAHLGFAVVALILSVLIILFPVFILVISYRRFRFTVNMTDVLNKDLKPSCKWWASFDLFRRLLVIFMVLLSNYVWPLYSQLALFYSGLFVFFIFACAQPYTSKTANIMEALILADFVLMSAIFLNRDVSVHENLIHPLEIPLLLLPFLSALAFLVFNMTAFIWKKFSPTDFRATCVAILCKVMRKIGINVPFQTNLECATRHPPLAKELAVRQVRNELVVAAEEDDIQYTQLREELLDD